MGKIVKAAPWAYSKIKNYETCPKQFYHVTVLNEHPFVENEHTRYGNAFHKAAELYVDKGTPIPKQFDFAAPMLEKLRGMKGTTYCEMKFGITKDLKPTGFFEKDVWFRGVIDYARLRDSTAYLLDYKTSKSSQYADKGQLDLMALAIFTHFPEIETVKGGILFVLPKEVVRETYHVDQKDDLWAKWIGKYGRMAKAFELDVWNPKPSGLCKRYCPVKQCPHHGV